MSFEKKAPVTINTAFFKRMLIIILVLMAGGGFATALGYYLTACDQLIADSLHFFQDSISADYGLSVSFKSIEPSLLRRIVIADLHVRSVDGSVDMKVLRANMFFDPISLVLGRKSTVLTMEIDNLICTLDLEKGMETLNHILGRFSGSGAGGPEILFSIRNARIDAIHGEERFEGTVPRASIFLGHNAIDLNLKGKLESILWSQKGKLEISAAVSGSISPDFKSARVEAWFAPQTPGFSIKEQNLTVILQNDIVEIRKTRDASLIDFSGQYALSDGSFTANLLLDGFKPSSVISLSSSVKLNPLIRSFFDIPYSGTIAASSKANLSDISVTANLNGYAWLDFLDDGFDFSLSAEATSNSIAVQHLDLKSTRGGLQASGKIAPANLDIDARIAMDYQASGLPIRFQTEASVYGRDREYYLFADSIRVHELTLGPFISSAILKDNSIVFSMESGMILSEDASLNQDDPTAISGEFTPKALPSSLRMDGLVDLTGPSIYASLSFDPIPIGKIAGRFMNIDNKSYDGLLGDFSIAGEVSIASDFRNISYNTRNLLVSSGESSSVYAVLSLNGNESNISLTEFFISAFGHSANGKGNVQFSNGSVVFSSGFSLDSSDYALQGFYREGILGISGDYGLEMSIASYEDIFSFRVKAAEFPVSIGGETLLVTIDSDGTARSLEEWSATISELSCYTTTRSSRMPEISLSGVMNNKSAAFPRVRIKDKYSEISGTLDAYYSWSYPQSVSGTLELSSPTGEKYAISGKVTESDIRALVTFVKTPLERILPGIITGNGNGNMELSGSPAKPDVTFNFTSGNAKVSGFQSSASLKGSFVQGKLVLSDGYARIEGWLFDTVRAEFDSNRKSVAFSAKASGSLGNTYMECKLNLSGVGSNESSPSFESSPSSDSAAYFLRGELSDFILGNIQQVDVPFNATFLPASVTIQAGMQKEVLLSFFKDGSLSGTLAKTLPVSFTASGWARGEALNVNIENLSVDIGKLGSLIAIPVIQLTGGQAQGALTIRGSLHDPDFFGSIRINNGQMLVPGFCKDEIGPITTTAEVFEKKIQIAASDIQVGKTARVMADFNATMGQWIPDFFSVHVATIDKSQINFKTGIVPWLDIDGLAELDLMIKSENSLLNVNGTIGVPRAEIIISPQKISSSETRNQLEYLIDIKTMIGKNVIVYFPSKDVPVIIGQTDPSSNIRYQMDSRKNSYSLDGFVTIRGGELFYLSRNFYIKSAKITFLENQDKFDPMADMNAQLRTRNSNGPVVISVSANNARLLDLNLRLESSPPLSTSEIAVMMGKGMFAVNEEGGMDIANAILNASELVPSFNIVRGFEKNIKEVLGLDLFYIRTQVLQRWLVDASNIAAQNEVSAEGDVSSYFDQTAIFAGKYLGDALFLEAGLFLQKEPLAQLGGLTIQSEFGFEWETPFFTLDWRVKPTDPATLFLTDQSFSFLWKYSFE